MPIPGITATNNRVPAGSVGAPGTPSPIASGKNEFSETPYRLAHQSPLDPVRSPLGSFSGQTASPDAAANLKSAANNF